MRSRGRVRAALKWISTALAVLILATLVATRWYVVVFEFVGTPDPTGNSELRIDNREIRLSVGLITLTTYRGPRRLERAHEPPFGRYFVRVNRSNWPGLRWRPVANTSYGREDRSEVALWAPLVVMLAVAGFTWHADIQGRQRTRAGACRSCGYDRRGLVGGAKCPECGTLPAT
jgi:hypothetical protein